MKKIKCFKRKRRKKTYKRKRMKTKRDNRCPAVWYDVEMYAKKNYILFENIRWLSLQWKPDEMMRLNVQHYGRIQIESKQKGMNAAESTQYPDINNTNTAQTMFQYSDSWYKNNLYVRSVKTTRQTKKWQQENKPAHKKLNRSYYGNLLKFMLRPSWLHSNIRCIYLCPYMQTIHTKHTPKFVQSFDVQSFHWKTVSLVCL